MKVFESLNCCLCKSPFVPIANQSKSPRSLTCGKAVCHECFEREKSLEEERKHQCEVADCFSNPNFAYALIDILSAESLISFPLRAGYMLSKAYEVPECSVCQETFSAQGENVPYSLDCLHDLCKECFVKCRKRDGEESPFQITCPKCNVVTSADEDCLDKPIMMFLEELPEMTRQLEEMVNTEFRFCENCKCVDSVERMFACARCDQNTKVCGTCVFQEHRLHVNHVIPLLKKEAVDLSGSLQKSSRKEVEAYQNLFPELHEKLSDNIEEFLKKLILQEESLEEKPNFVTLQKASSESKQFKDDFESSSEEYLPNLRKYNAKLEDLIKDLEQKLA